MHKVLSKISGPLLVGSILALGALAFPSHADAQGTRVFFRTPGLLPMTVAAAPDNGDTGETGGGEEAPKFAYFVAEYGDGWSFECRTEWSAGDLATYKSLVESAAINAGGSYGGAAPVEAVLNPGANPVFSVTHSTFGAVYSSAGATTVQYGKPLPGDPRPWPDISGHPSAYLPCTYEGPRNKSGRVNAGNTSGEMRALPLLSTSIVYK